MKNKILLSLALLTFTLGLNAQTQVFNIPVKFKSVSTLSPIGTTTPIPVLGTDGLLQKVPLSEILALAGGGGSQNLEQILTNGNVSHDIYPEIYDGEVFMEYGGSGIYNYMADPSQATSLLFNRTAEGGIQYRFDPDKIAGVYTIATVEDITGGSQDLHSVLNEGTLASKDSENSYVNFLGGSENDRIIELEVYNGGDADVENSSTIHMNNSDMKLENTEEFNRGSKPLLDNASVTLESRKDAIYSTSLVIPPPTEDVISIINLPSKLAGGTYTLATTDDINHYNSSEKVVGTWVTGKPIYRRTYSGVTTSGVYSVYNLESINLKDFIDIQVVADINENGKYSRTKETPLVGINNAFFIPNVVTSDTPYFEIYARNSNMATNLVRNIIVTIDYTKTTD